MNDYKFATICENGHTMSSSDRNYQPFCSECGAPTLSDCPSCGSPIHGDLRSSGGIVIIAPFKPDLYCYNCGKPYPWTQRIIDSATEILLLDEELSEEQRDVLKNAIPDLLVHTPKTPVAVARYKTFLNKAPKLIGSALYQVFIDVVSETVKRSLFPQQQQ